MLFRSHSSTRPRDKGAKSYGIQGQGHTLIAGHGIGLAYARALARAMGGDITVTSQPSEGTCFTLQMRFAPDESEAAQPRTALG